MKIRWTRDQSPKETDLKTLERILDGAFGGAEVFHDPQHFEAASEIIAYAAEFPEDFVVASARSTACINAIISPNFTIGRFAFWQTDHRDLPAAVFYRSPKEFLSVVRLFPCFATKVGARELVAIETVRLDPDPDDNLVGAGS